jgi:hypothetical protein
MSFKLKSALAFACLVGLIGAARAQDSTGCEKFKWSVARERALFAAGPKPAASGATIAAGAAYAVALAPSQSVVFAAAPERAPKPGTFGATLSVAIDKPGAYQVTMSDEAWLDVVQAGAEVKSSAFSGQKDCPGVRKSVRFDLAAGPATVQISNAAAAAINVALEPAP